MQPVKTVPAAKTAQKNTACINEKLYRWKKYGSNPTYCSKKLRHNIHVIYKIKHIKNKKACKPRVCKLFCGIRVRNRCSCAVGACSQKGGNEPKALWARLQANSRREWAFLRMRRNDGACDWFFFVNEKSERSKVRSDVVRHQGLEPWTHWLRVNCSTNWANGAFLTPY